MGDIKNIEKFIDKILDKPRWTGSEYGFYDLLRRKIAQYNDKMNSYTDVMNEKDDIISNIHEQTWFSTSKYVNQLNSILSEMEIEGYNIDMGQGYLSSDLHVRFPKSKFTLHAVFNLNWENAGQVLQYQIYVEDFGEINKAYIAYNDTMNTHNLPKDIKLPQTREMLDIIKVGSYVSKIELLKLFSEIVLYYDETEMIAKTFIGQAYPITLKYIITKM